MISMNVTPKFSTKKININFGFYWFEIQNKCMDAADIVSQSMIKHINKNVNRTDSGGGIVKYLVPEKIGVAGKGEVHWAIGCIMTLNATVPYWYVLNSGKKVSGERFSPGDGKYRPYMFTDGKADSNKSGTGVGRGKAIGFRPSTNKTSYYNPINYIEHGRFVAGRELSKIMALAKARGVL